MTETLAIVGDTAMLLTVGAAAVWDLRTRRIPNLLVVGGLVLALGLHALQGGAALLGCALGAVVALTAGILLYSVGLIGAGDAKLLCAAAAFLGVRGVPAFFAFAALAGGALALVSALRQHLLLRALRDAGQLTMRVLSMGMWGAPAQAEAGRRLTLPYAVAIAAGAVAARFL